MTFVDAASLGTLFSVWAVFFCLFGLGVGGEFPLSASVAAEQHIETTDDAKMDNEQLRAKRNEINRAKTLRRGETIALVFAMQGMSLIATFFAYKLSNGLISIRSRCSMW